MTEASNDVDRFATSLHAAYHEVRLHSPQGVDDVEERLRRKLEANDVKLTSDVLRALAFAIVNDRSV